MGIDNDLITVSQVSSVWQMERTCASEAYKLAIPLPEVPGYKWGWLRFSLGGYTHNENPEKDDKNLNAAVDNGWMPVIKSPHEALPLNKAGYVTVGDLVLCVKKVEGVAECEYLVDS